MAATPAGSVDPRLWGRRGYSSVEPWESAHAIPEEEVWVTALCCRVQWVQRVPVDVGGLPGGVEDLRGKNP